MSDTLWNRLRFMGLLGAVGVVVALGLAGSSEGPRRTDSANESGLQGLPPGLPSGDLTQVQRLHAAIKKLEPLQQRLGLPRVGDWRAEHSEQAQTFDDYVRSDPRRALGQRKILYVMQIGPLSGAQAPAFLRVKEFLSIYFQLEVRELSGVALDDIPAKARRVHPQWGDHQILSTYVLDEILAPRLPDDAAALLALTASDLWPQPGWNFVFGQASLEKRVGVWSLYRNGDPEKTPELFLRRTLKFASHETAHMFSMRHETRYQCNMCGANNHEEADAQPLWLCAESMAKLSFATGADPQRRYRELAAWSELHGLATEARFYRRSIALLE